MKHSCSLTRENRQPDVADIHIVRVSWNILDFLNQLSGS